MIEFNLGIRTPLRTTLMPASARRRQTSWGTCRPGRRISNRARQPVSSHSMTRFFAACATQDAVGCGVAPRIADPPVGVLDYREQLHPRP
jgi:hypothetical protein